MNEFLKEHRRADEQQKKVANLEGSLAEQKKQIETLTSALQKVSDRVELRAVQPQVVAHAR